MAKLTDVDAPKIGRPKSEEPGSPVMTWLKQSEHDRLIELAKKHETTISSLVRQFVILKLR